ncbi:hypothetical protein C9F11_17970 [Streptomyces sp. YIM 121038]|uniref:hypothetical protein n=1 Tax=Streptomyces sp. YIM 121038 TaxID=2136401 RepID=UPI0011103404|nr:hypothetical protein [Streptomyces sp. YIM 121038]QCX77246.1 hypothetical protein C9F11_17970 [Streptomyces sp. YIM 121038]
MADESDVLLELWKGQRDEARQMENQRAALTNIVILVAAAALGFLTQQGHLELSSLGVTVPLCVLGAFGAAASSKYGERWAVHSGLADRLRDELAARHPHLDLDALVAANRTEHRAEFPLASRMRVWILWVALHTAIGAGALLLSLWIVATQ